MRLSFISLTIPYWSLSWKSEILPQNKPTEDWSPWHKNFNIIILTIYGEWIDRSLSIHSFTINSWNTTPTYMTQAVNNLMSQYKTYSLLGLQLTFNCRCSVRKFLFGKKVPSFYPLDIWLAVNTFIIIKKIFGNHRRFKYNYLFSYYTIWYSWFCFYLYIL